MTRRSFRPVKSIDQIDDTPPAPPRPGVVRVNMMTRPFGDHVGPSSEKLCVRMRSPEPSGRITPIANVAPNCFVNAIRSPRGDHTGVV